MSPHVKPIPAAGKMNHKEPQGGIIMLNNYLLGYMICNGVCSNVGILVKESLNSEPFHTWQFVLDDFTAHPHQNLQ